MTTLFYLEPELVIALSNKVIFVNPNDLQIFKEVELPPDLVACGLKIPKNSNEDQPEDSKKHQKTNAAPTESPSIKHVSLSPNRQLLAITTTGAQKAVLLYQCRPEHAKLVSVRALVKASSALTFSSDSNMLLAMDKTGDGYQYDCVDLEAAPRLLFGHLSIVYDVIWTPDRKHIITCDRDDKIRVTNYPETHDIHGYCLGHREFVAGLALLQDEVIASVSGDKTLRVWNFLTGKELVKADLPAPAIRVAARPLDTSSFQLAVLLHQPDECVALYKISHSDEEQWDITEIGTLNFPGVIPANLCFAEERLYLAGVVNEHFTLKVADGTPPAPTNWLSMVEEQFKEHTWKPEDVSEWFKKRFDNVSDYLERKKRRIEDKQK